jgi:hypothetical protein
VEAHGNLDATRLAAGPVHEPPRHARDLDEPGTMQEATLACAAPDDAASDTRTDHPTTDRGGDSLTSDDEELMDHWHLARVHQLDAVGHIDRDATRIATESLLEHIRGSHVPDASAQRVLTRIARLAHGGEPGQWAMETRVRERAHAEYSGASSQDARIIADYHSAQALERQQCHANDPQWLVLTAPRVPATTPARTPMHAPTAPTRQPTSPPASPAGRRAPAALAWLGTAITTAALACSYPPGTDNAPPDPPHHSSRCATTCGLAAIGLFRATMARANHGTAPLPPPPAPHTMHVIDATPAPLVHLSAPNAERPPV